MLKTIRAPLLAVLSALAMSAQGVPGFPPPPPNAAGGPPSSGRTADQQRLDSLDRKVDTLYWYLRMADIADVDEVEYTSLPPAREPNPTAQGAGNPVVVHALTFIPKKLDRTKKHPLVVFAHGGVHSNTGSNYVHIFREMVERGWTVITPDYRGSTGYGASLYNQIDYGGREVDDVDKGREWMLERYSFLDPTRVAMIGWSHGGLITLLNIFERPKNYVVAYAGVPVSDLVARMGYKSESYRAIFSARNHIGKSADEDVKEYLRRSPVTHVEKLQTPLLVHTTTNDEDVNVLEVQRLIAALKAAGKKFEYKIYENAPGGHVFNRLDTKLARDSREEIWKFLERYLK